jgi:selenocysteine-specific elongation factor
MRHVVIGTAGHIDHGKSTLVRALTGIDPDRLQEEKARGITIDLGFAHDVRGDVTLAFVDVPGHERFVKNMLAGATGIDVLLLVVAADESVMPQTREHFDICRLLQVPAGVVAITKADTVDADTVELVKLEVRDLTAGSFLAEAPILPVSSVTGVGLDALRAALVTAAAHAPARRDDGPFRLPVDRVFSVKGFGTVVTGTVVSGAASVDDEVSVLPAGRTVKVRGLQGHGAPVPRVRAGQRAAVNLAGLEVEDLARGDTLATPGTFDATRRLDAVLDVLAGARPLRHGARVRFHHGTGETLGRVAVSKVLGEDEAAGVTEIRPGGRAHVRLRLEKPVVLTRGDRFVLRAYSPPVTIAGGRVLDPQPARGGIRTPAGRRRFDTLDAGPAEGDVRADGIVDRTVAAFVEEQGGQGLPRAVLVTRAGLTPAEADAAVARLAAAGAVVPLAGLLVSPAILRGLSTALERLLEEYHAANPLSEGVPREEARERVFARAHPLVFEAVLQRLVQAGRITARDRLSSAAHRVTLAPDEEAARQRIDSAFREAGLRPPDLSSLADVLGLPAAAVGRALEVLQRQKTLVKVDALWFHAHALEALKAEVRALKEAPSARVDVATFKDRYGVSRKYAIPLLEYLDRERITRRVGDARVVL